LSHVFTSAPTFDDWEGVHDAVAQAYFPHSMRPLSRGPAGLSKVGVVDLGPCRVTRMSLGATVRVQTDHPGAWAVNIAASGRLEHRIAGTAVVSDAERATVCPPDTPMQLPSWDPSCTLVGFRVDEEFLRREYERVLARRPRPLPRQLDLRSDTGHDWLAWITSALDRATSDSPGLLADPRMQRQLGELLVTGLLLTGAADEPLGTRGTQPRIVRRVVTAIEDDPARLWTPAELAELAGVSVRRLQQGFREYVGQTPFQYLHGVRLDRAHHDLVHAEDATTVTEVAMRWGLSHTGRFAADYRRRFGQSPSTTLHS
jgi:AraC-like DNA-binding protein